ncbi:MAG: hypothetical protein K1X72_03920 [Pyrinomonadaceae bacterium]|nr:hypothetical protein [Pyrinomonadaceae bacterium]
MKKIIAITVILLAGFNLWAQETKIEKSEFDLIMGDSFKAIRNQPYRTIEISESQNFAGTTKTKIITERLGANSRTIYEFDSPGMSSKNEAIFFNGRRFKRNLEKSWIEETTEIKPSAPSIYETLSNEILYYSLGDKISDEKNFKVYKTVENRKQLNKERGDESEWHIVTTFWFDQSGLLVKKERLMELTMKPKKLETDTFVRKETKVITKSLSTTEIDPSIKIEAPQIG